MSRRTLLCYGDSNTHGTLPMTVRGERRRLAPELRWPGIAAAALGDGWRVVEEGLPGRTTLHPDPIEGAHLNGLAVLPAILASHRPIDIVALMLGTNDLKRRFGVSAAEIGDALVRLAREIRISDAGPDRRAPALLLIAPPPILEAGCLADIFAGGAAKSAGLSAAVRQTAEIFRAGFLDAGSVIASSPIDGVHFEAAAHAALGRAVAAGVAAQTEGEAG